MHKAGRLSTTSMRTLRLAFDPRPWLTKRPKIGPDVGSSVASMLKYKKVR